jgi:excisionase family DNA binding protein
MPRVTADVERHYSPEELAELLRVHPRTIIRWCRSGRLCRARRIGRSIFRIPSSAVASFLKGTEVR